MVRHALVDIGPLRTSPVFRRLWIGRAASMLGSQLALVAVLFQVWRQTGSTVWTGAVGLAQAVPLVGFGLFAGALLDKADRRRVYLVSTLGQAGCAVGLAVQGAVGGLPVLGVLALVAVQAGFGAAGGPAARTFVPRLLPKEQVAAGLALTRIAMQATMLVGPAIGGLVIAASGVGGCYLVDAISFLAGCYGAAGLPPLRPEGDAARAGLGGIRDGLGFLLRTPIVRGALLTDLATTVLSFPISLFPALNAARFGDDPRTLGLFLTAIAVGGVTASVLSGTFTRHERPGALVLAGSATWGVSLAVLGIASQRWLALGLLVVAGAADTVSVIARGTVVAVHTPDALRGRVAAAEQIVGQAGPDLGNVRAGLVARASSIDAALLSGGLFCLAAVAAVGALTPALRRADVAPAMTSRA